MNTNKRNGRKTRTAFFGRTPRALAILLAVLLLLTEPFSVMTLSADTGDAAAETAASAGEYAKEGPEEEAASAGDAKEDGSAADTETEPAQPEEGAAGTDGFSPEDPAPDTPAEEMPAGETQEGGTDEENAAEDGTPDPYAGLLTLPELMAVSNTSAKATVQAFTPGTGEAPARGYSADAYYVGQNDPKFVRMTADGLLKYQLEFRSYTEWEPFAVTVRVPLSLIRTGEGEAAQNVLPEQIVIGSGSEYLYNLIVQMLGRDRVFALEDPSYEKIRLVYEASGVQCRMIPMDREGVRLGALGRTEASVLHVTPFNSYPSGITATASRRAGYIRWAAGKDRFIIEDDFDSEFSMSTKAEDTLFSLEPLKSVIYMNTFTRTISPAVRVGYMVLPAELSTAMQEKISFYSCTVPVFTQHMLAELIRSGDFERHINRVRRRRRQALAR